MKKGKFFSPAVYGLTLKRLRLPFIVFTVLSGIALFFLLFLTKTPEFFSLEELIEQLCCYVGLLALGTVMFPILAFPQIRKRRDADYFDSLPQHRTAVFSGCALGSATYALLAVLLLYLIPFLGWAIKYDLWQLYDLSPLKKLWVIGKSVLSTLLPLLSETLLFSAIAILARVLCGRTFKALSVAVLFRPVVRGLFALFLLLFDPFLYDAPKWLLALLSPRIAQLSCILDFDIFSDDSFLNLLFGAAMGSADVSGVKGFNVFSPGVRFAYYMIVSAILLVLGGLVYKKRRSEELKKDTLPRFTAYLLPTLLLALPCGLLGAMIALPPLKPVQSDVYGMTILQRMAGYELFFESAGAECIALFAGICFVILLLIASKCKIKPLLRLLPTALPSLLLGAALSLTFNAVCFYHQIDIPAEQIVSVSFDSPIDESGRFYQDYLRLNSIGSNDPAVLEGLAEGISIDLNEPYTVHPVTLTLKNGLKVRRLTTTHQIVSTVREDEGKLIKPLDPEEFERFNLQIGAITIPLDKEQARRYFECYNRYDVKEQKAAYKAYDSAKPALTFWASIPYETRVPIYNYGGHTFHNPSYEQRYETATVYHTFRFDPPGKEAEDLLYEILYETARSYPVPDLSETIKHTEYFLSVKDTTIAENYYDFFRISLDLYTAEGIIKRDFRQSDPDVPIGDTLDLLKLLQTKRANEGEEQKEYLLLVRVNCTQIFPEKYSLSKVFPVYLTADGYAALPRATPYGE